MKIELYLEIPDTVKPDIRLEINGETIPDAVVWEKNEFGHYPCVVDYDVKKENVIKLYVKKLGSVIDKSKFLNIQEMIIDDINFDIVHTMNCRAQPDGLEYQLGATQLDNDGYLEIPFNLPVWEYWCQVNNGFRYEDYPAWQ